jgi:hypothetical protein
LDKDPLGARGKFDKRLFSAAIQPIKLLKLNFSCYLLFKQVIFVTCLFGHPLLHFGKTGP